METLCCALTRWPGHNDTLLLKSPNLYSYKRCQNRFELISGCDSCTYLSIAATSEEIPNTPLSGCELRFGM
ncbi:hypothetical protein M8J75_009722 [Diaphorina citri]|nr:hypothetical protein M8J75_009722 [Diaphorina citri]